MAKGKSVDKLERHLMEKRRELICRLSEQDYTEAQIARIFGIHRSTVMRILNKKRITLQ